MQDSKEKLLAIADELEVDGFTAGAHLLRIVIKRLEEEAEASKEESDA